MFNMRPLDSSHYLCVQEILRSHVNCAIHSQTSFLKKKKKGNPVIIKGSKMPCNVSYQLLQL